MLRLAFEIETTVYQGRLGQKVNPGHSEGSDLTNLHELSAAGPDVFILQGLSASNVLHQRRVCVQVGPGFHGARGDFKNAAPGL